MPQVPQMPQFQEGAPINQVSQVPTTPSLGNGNVVSLDQLGDMSFANPPISQAPATAPTVNATTQPTPAPQGGSKAMLVAFLILIDSTFPPVRLVAVSHPLYMPPPPIAAPNTPPL